MDRVAKRLRSHRPGGKSSLRGRQLRTLQERGRRRDLERREHSLNNPLLRGPVSVYSLSMDPRDPAKVYFIANVTALAFFANPDAGQTWSAAAFVGLVPNRVGVDFAGKNLRDGERQQRRLLSL